MYLHLWWPGWWLRQHWQGHSNFRVAGAACHSMQWRSRGSGWQDECTEGRGLQASPLLPVVRQERTVLIAACLAPDTWPHCAIASPVSCHIITPSPSTAPLSAPPLYCARRVLTINSAVPPLCCVHNTTIKDKLHVGGFESCILCDFSVYLFAYCSTFLMSVNETAALRMFRWATNIMVNYCRTDRSVAVCIRIWR